MVEDLPEEEVAEGAEAAPPEAQAGENEKAAAEAEAAYIPAEGEEPAKKFNPKTEIQLKDAVLIDPEYQIGAEIVTPLEVPGAFGRMAAQTAKQVIIQKLREEERQIIFDEYKALEHELINGTVQRREGRNVLVDIGHAAAIMPPEEQVERERYNIGNRLKFYLKAVEQTAKGPQIIVSRSDAELVKKIFATEIPEIANNSIEIKSLSREAGSRSKVAIATNDENIDPIGSCVGQRGMRIQMIISELSNEKVDIILWDDDATKFIANALSPAKVVSVKLDEDNRVAVATVREDQLSLAIGKGGQNVRLASRLTGWKIDIIPEAGGKPAAAAPAVEEAKEEAAEAAPATVESIPAEEKNDSGQEKAAE